MIRAGAGVIGVALALVTVAPGLQAAQIEDYVCWTRSVEADDPEVPRRAVVCRVGGSALIGFDRPVDVPVVLSPAVAADAAGTCWFWINRSTDWVLIRTDGDRALLHYAPDVGGTGPAAADAWVRRCEGEPDTGPTPIELVWEVVRSHDFPRPAFVLDPVRGVTGLETFVSLHPPEPVTVTVVSPVTGAVVEAELVASLVRVEWGDGAASSLIPAPIDTSAPGPGGALRHRYERSGLHTLVVAYHWSARWRVDGGAWRLLPLEPTTAPVAYPVDELVGRRTS